MRLKEDNTSWKSRGIIRRDFRHDPGLPETEVPRNKSTTKKYKKKHDHTWKVTVLGKITVSDWARRPDGSYYRVPREVEKVQHICTRCGYKLTYTGGRRWGW